MAAADYRTQRERILSALYDYVDLGLPVIPLCSHDHRGYSARHISKCNQAGKVPLIKGWQTHENTTHEQVRSWIKEFKNINIGLPLGHASGYVGIDVDGEVGEELLWEMSKGDLPDTWEYTTGAGRRLLYAIPVGLQTKKFTNAGDGEHQECSILAFGQQTVLPPSIHHTGKIYEWIEGHSPEDIDCAMAPKWLIDLVRLDSRISPGGIGTIDLTKPTPKPSQDAPKASINPILVTDTVLPAEFSEFESVEMDLTPPDTDYVGKPTKAQEQEEENRLTAEELTQKITAGNRDNQMTRIIGHFCAKFRDLGKDYIMLMAKNHNQVFCDPPLDEMAIEAKVNHFWEMEQMKTAQYKQLKAAAEDKKQFAPLDIAQVVLNRLEEQGYCIKADSSEAIIWLTKKSEGPWKAYNVHGTGGEFQVFIKDPISDPELGGDPRWATKKHIADVVNALLTELRAAGRIWDTDRKNLDTQTVDAYKYIPLKGGKLLDWRTGELKPWDPETNLTYVLPVEYDPNAKCPAWERRLAEWLPDEGSRKIMQEFVGYSLIPYMGFEKALMIVGEGANGKSLFLETIQGMLGYEVVGSINMRSLFSRFGPAELLGKILNIVNEAGSEYLRGAHADDFKNLVSGGRIIADVKNKAPLTFNNTAKFIFASNHDVKTSDKSEGWLRRMLIVPFEQDFSKSPVPKYEIMSELRKEYAGIFNWALEGLRRLMQNKQFSTSEAAQRKMDEYRYKNDIAADFFIHCLEGPIPILGVSGKPVERGTATTAIEQLFKLWIQYRESTLIKDRERITEYLIKKGFQKKRAVNPLLSKSAKTMCWINLKVNIRDEGFLEELRDSLEASPEIREYAIKKLAEIDGDEERVAKGLPREATVTELPTSQTSSN